uniref:Uncharacterized protein n=1 Tax=Acanthochromis polyacanthus TaxID=80966 RepID=A0A3Q1GTB5_9TELE
SISLRWRLQQLQSRFTWKLEEEDLQLDDLSRQLELGQRGATAHYCRLLAYVRYLQVRPQEALALLSQSEDRTRECYGEDSERRLIVTYGDMAWMHYHHGDHKQAESYCSREKHPSGSSEFLPEVFGEKGWTFLKFSKSLYPAAIQCFRDALKLQPDDWEWNTGLAIALYRTEPQPAVLGTSPEESPATQQLRRALKFCPDDGVLLALLALKLQQQHQHHEAEVLVEKALVGPNDDQVIRYVAKYLRLQDQLDQSIGLLLRALKGSSQSAFIHHQLGLCYLRKKKNLLSINSGSGSGCSEVQRWRRLSIHHLEEAVRLKNGLNSAKADLALQYLSPVNGNNPADGASYGILGYVARAEGDYRRAARFYEDALEREPQNTEFLSILCELRLQLD